MAGILSLWSLLPDNYDPLPRLCHVSCRVGGKLIVHGGLTKDFSENNRQHLSWLVDIFDNYSEKWERRPVGGVTPSIGTYKAACTPLNKDLMFFGGYDGIQYFNTLYKLDTESWLWNQLSPQNADGAPMPKFGCGMISLGDSIGVVGGFGIPPGPIEPQSFILNTNSSIGEGWTSEFHTYNISKGVWSCLITTGEKPPPCAHFTFTAVDERQAIVFGGLSGERGRTNDVFIFNLYTKFWRKLNQPEDGHWPEERSSHAACCLDYGQKFPQLLITGGANGLDKPLSDIWIMDIELEKWRKVNVYKKARFGHSLNAFRLAPGLIEVIEFGGSSEPWTGSHETQQRIADTTLLQFMLVESAGQSQWELLSVADNKQLGSPERMIKKMMLLLMDKEREEERVKKEMSMIEKERKEMEEERDRLKSVLQQSQAKYLQEINRANQEKEIAKQERKRANELQKRLDEIEHDLIDVL